ncbi:MAG: RNA methyltransferase [Hyphomicrobiales bacterium]
MAAVQDSVVAPRRGYFGIGLENISKPMNAGNLLRSAHAFGASFFFTIGARFEPRSAPADTSRAPAHLPVYAWEGLDDMVLPEGCSLVGVELLEEAVPLPSFHHPTRAAYVLGPERGSLSPALLERCDHVVKIPSAFCINVATAGAIVMYDRIRVLGRFPDRPVSVNAVPLPRTGHVHGKPKRRRKQ